MEHMRTQTIERTDTDERVDDGTDSDIPKYFHYVKKDKIAESAVMGTHVVALCGEYVIELLHYIWERRSLFDVAVLGRWLRDNPEFYARTRSRVISYWDCYYRTARFEDYVGSQLVAFFDESTTMQPHETGDT